MFEQNFKFMGYALNNALSVVIDARNNDYCHAQTHAHDLAKHAQRVSGYYGERLTELANLAFEIVYNLQIVVSLSAESNDKRNAKRRLDRRVKKLNHLHYDLLLQYHHAKLMQN